MYAIWIDKEMLIFFFFLHICVYKRTSLANFPTTGVLGSSIVYSAVHGIDYSNQSAGAGR